MIRPWNRRLAPAASETWLVPSWRRILYEKIKHVALRLSPKIARNAAPSTKSHTPTSPNTAPATQNESHDWSASPVKRHLQCAEQQESPSNFTKFSAPATQTECHDWSASPVKRHLQRKVTVQLHKYCACQAKWISSLIRLTHETSFIMRGATKVTSQTHQYCACHAVMNRMSDPRNIWNVISNERSN